MPITEIIKPAFAVIVLLILLYPLTKKGYISYLRKKAIYSVHSLFVDINPFLVSLDARQQMHEMSENLVYGEVGLDDFLWLLEYVQPRGNQHFYDLGSGCGKAAILSKIRYPTMKVTGVEILPALHRIAEQKWTEYQSHHKLRSPANELHFICDNMLARSFEDADIIFINATAIPADMWSKLLDKFLSLKVGAILIVTSKAINHRSFSERHSSMKLMSWGYTSTYIYQKIG